MENKIEFFDPNLRKEEKQKSRDQDEENLKSGKKSQNDLRRENGLFIFRNVKINYVGAIKLAWSLFYELWNICDWFFLE